MNHGITPIWKGSTGKSGTQDTGPTFFPATHMSSAWGRRVTGYGKALMNGSSVPFFSAWLNVPPVSHAVSAPQARRSLAAVSPGH
jgi:hypothetical protein